MAYKDTLFEEHLASLTPLVVNDGALQAILFNRGVEEGAVVGDVSLKDRELCYADMLMWCADSPSMSGSVSDTDGGWSHKEVGARMSDIERSDLRRKAKSIYLKYGEPFLKKGTIKLHNQGMRIW